MAEHLDVEFPQVASFANSERVTLPLDGDFASPDRCFFPDLYLVPIAVFDANIATEYLGGAVHNQVATTCDSSGISDLQIGIAK